MSGAPAVSAHHAAAHKQRPSVPAGHYKQSQALLGPPQLHGSLHRPHQPQQIEMAWGFGGKDGPGDADGSGGSRFGSAVPPPCPRCELTKSQVRVARQRAAAVSGCSACWRQPPHALGLCSKPAAAAAAAAGSMHTAAARKPYSSRMAGQRLSATLQPPALAAPLHAATMRGTLPPPPPPTRTPAANTAPHRPPPPDEPHDPELPEGL